MVVNTCAPDVRVGEVIVNSPGTVIAVATQSPCTRVSVLCGAARLGSAACVASGTVGVGNDFFAFSHWWATGTTPI